MIQSLRKKILVIFITFEIRVIIFATEATNRRTIVSRMTLKNILKQEYSGRCSLPVNTSLEISFWQVFTTAVLKRKRRN